MNLVDSSGWIEYFVGGPNADMFASAIQDTGRLIVPTVVIAEVYRWTLRKRTRDEADRTAAALRAGTVVELTPEIAIHAARLGFDNKLPLADSVIYATALHCEAEVWTQDADFNGLASVKFIPKRP